MGYLTCKVAVISNHGLPLSCVFRLARRQILGQLISMKKLRRGRKNFMFQTGSVVILKLE